MTSFEQWVQMVPFNVSLEFSIRIIRIALVTINWGHGSLINGWNPSSWTVSVKFQINYAIIIVNKSLNQFRWFPFFKLKQKGHASDEHTKTCSFTWKVFRFSILLYTGQYYLLYYIFAELIGVRLQLVAIVTFFPWNHCF